MKTQKTHALFQLFLLSLLWAASTELVAAGRGGLLELHMVQRPDGLMTAEPRISQHELNKALVENHHLVKVRSQKLEDYIEENKITAKTGVVAAIMPGGLIYLAVRKARLSEAGTRLESLQADVNKLPADHLALHNEEATILVASIP